jgi:hypothetical protein
MGVEFGVEVVGVLGGAQGRLGAVFRTLANEFGIAPLRVAAFNRAPQHGVAGVDVVVPELGSLVVGVDADHDVSCDDDPSRVDSTPIFQARQPFAEFQRSSSADLDLLDSPLSLQACLGADIHERLLLAESELWRAAALELFVWSPLRRGRPRAL